MQRDLLLLTEMIDAAEQAQLLVEGITVRQLEADRQRRDAPLWNFTVLGEAAGQISEPSPTWPPSACCTSAACATAKGMDELFPVWRYAQIRG